VVQCLTIRHLSSPYPDLVLSGRLAYDTAEPYAVYLGVAEVRPSSGGEPPVCWTFGRDLIEEAFDLVPSGEESDHLDLDGCLARLLT